MHKYDRMAVTVRTAKGRLILRGKIDHISRFGVIQDYTITLDDGLAIEINSGAVELIALEWISQHKEKAIAVLAGTTGGGS